MIVEEIMAYLKKRKISAEPQQNLENTSLNDEISNEKVEENTQEIKEENKEKDE
jgi:hypothetical protein